MKVIPKETDKRLYEDYLRLNGVDGLMTMFEKGGDTDPLLLASMHGPFPLLSHAIYAALTALNVSQGIETSSKEKNYYLGMLAMLTIFQRVLEAQEMEGA